MTNDAAMLMWIVLSLGAGAAGAELREDFGSLKPDRWRLSAGGDAQAAVQDGQLVLDMSKPKRGKWALADLSLAAPMPARIEWDQCMAHDSEHAYFAGLWLTSVPRGKREALRAGLGGGGLGRVVFLEGSRSPAGQVEPGKWYTLRLDLQPTRQVLTVFERGRQKPLLVLDTWRVMSHGPFRVRFFQCDTRLGPGNPDTYDQDRGTTWIDNLRITAAAFTTPKPRPTPAVTNPFAVPIVFNRTMRWLTREHGLTRGCIAYDAAGWLPLTGSRAASRWLELKAWRGLKPCEWPEQPNEAHVGERVSEFALPKAAKEATFALRAFQCNLEQHGTLALDAQPNAVEWRLDVYATDGVRPRTWPLWSSGWMAKADTSRIDLRAVYRQAGRPNRYAEINVLLKLRGAAGGRLRLKLGFEGMAAVAPRWPIVATAKEAAARGVVVEAVVVGPDGAVAAGADAALHAECNARRWPMQAVGEHGIRRGVIEGLAAGEHEVRLVASEADGRELAATTVTVSVTNLDFLTHYDAAKRSYCAADGRAAGPLLGDLFAWTPYSEFTPTRRRLILGMENRQEEKLVYYTKWRALPRGDIDTYIDYMARSGVRVLRLTPNVSPGEYYLDAGGRLAPHGMEQFAYILAAARRNGMRAVINLHHYPYLSASTGRKPPVQRYVDAGYPKRMKWTSDAMWRYLSSYLGQLLGFTGDDPAVMAYTVMGENDQFLPAQWLNRAHDLIKARAPRQMVVLEQGGCFRIADGRLQTWRKYKPAHDGGLGYRTYHTGRHKTDCFMAVAARMFDMTRPSYLGEVSCGIHTDPAFVTKYRDAMGIALTLQQPMSIAWSAAMVEGQCKAFTEAARQVDWTAFRRARPPVAVVVDKVESADISRLVQIEEALAAAPLDYEYVREPFAREAYALVVDARREAPNLSGLKSVAERAGLRLSPGNHCTYALSEDRRWLLAYIRNARHYEIGLCDIRSVGRYRLADREREVQIRLRAFAGVSRYRIWDAASARVVSEGEFAGAATIMLRATPADLLLLVSPQQEKR